VSGPAVSPATVSARSRRRETLPAGTEIGRYVIRDLLGAGGMGVVYIALDTALDRRVALKVLRPDLAGDPATLAERLVRESRLMAKASHPGVITVHDVGRDGDQVYVAMELIAGETLGKWLKREPRTVEEVVEMFRRAGAGLGAAHRAGLVHRDFKPDNVLVELDGGEVRRVLVTDFGVARAAVGDESPSSERPPSGEVVLTATGVAVGTPAYMAPEQLSGHDVDERADVFGFAVSLWEALYGVRPFAGATPALIRAAMNTPPAPPGQRPAHAARGRVPAWITRALLAALVADPRARTPSIAALLAALDPAPRRRNRRRVAAALAALVGSGGVVLGVLAWPSDAAVPDPCKAGLDALAARWSPARSADARAVLTGKAQDAEGLDAALRHLDKRAEGWRDVHLASCKAQPAAITACLDARLKELDAISGELLGATRVAVEFPDIVVNLVGDPVFCPTGAPALREANVPDDPALQRAVAEIRRQIFAIENQRIAGDYQGALAAVPAVEAAAGAAGWDRVTAEVQYLRGSIETVGSDTRHGIELLRQAATTAQRAHHDAMAASVWIVLAHATATDLRETERALEYLDYAAAAVERVGSPPDLAAQVLYTRGIVETNAHRPDPAEAHTRQALAIAEQGAPELIGTCVQGLAYILEDRGHHADAAAQYERALALHVEAFGDDHPEQVTYRGRLAYNLVRSGRYDEGVAQARKALAVAQATLDDKQIDRMHAHSGLSEVLLIAGHFDEALAESEQAVAMAEAIVGDKDQLYAEVLNARGVTLMAMQRAREAERTFSRACQILEFTIDDESIGDSVCRVDQAAALVDTGRAKAALHVLDSVQPIVETSDDPADLANLQLVRADALRDLGRHRDAVSLYEQALVGFATDPERGYTAQAEFGLARSLAATDPAAARAHATTAIEIWRAAAPMWRPDLKQAEAWLRKR
jgi:tetratricopeptide (TPR) repeat protein